MPKWARGAASVGCWDQGPLPDRDRSFKERLGLAGFALARVEDSETYQRPVKSE